MDVVVKWFKKFNRKAKPGRHRVEDRKVSENEEIKYFEDLKLTTDKGSGFEYGDW